MCCGEKLARKSRMLMLDIGSKSMHEVGNSYLHDLIAAQ